MSDEDDNEVGYGKPPKHTRFKRGQSGNRKGRPKGSRNFKTELEAALTEKVTVTMNGRPERVTARMATLLRLREKALKGDQRAIDRLLQLAAQDWDEQSARETRKLRPADLEIMRRHVQNRAPENPSSDGLAGEERDDDS